MEINLTTPALLFPALSLLMLAYTNRFLSLANLIRTLHAAHLTKPDERIITQLQNLRQRVLLIRSMQSCGVASIFSCALCMFLLFAGLTLAGKWVFGVGVLFLMGSLVLSFWEIQISVVSLNVALSDLEDLAFNKRKAGLFGK